MSTFAQTLKIFGGFITKLKSHHLSDVTNLINKGQLEEASKIVTDKPSKKEFISMIQEAITAMKLTHTALLEAAKTNSNLKDDIDKLNGKIHTQTEIDNFREELKNDILKESKLLMGNDESIPSLRDMIREEVGLIVSQLKEEESLPQSTTDKSIHSLILEDTKHEAFTEQKWSDVLKGSLSEKLQEVPVTKSTLTAKGKGYVAFPDRESRDIAAKALKDDFIVVESDKKTKNLLPKMKICDLVELNKNDTEKLKTLIPKKNPKIRALVDGGATLEVVFIHEPTDTDNFYSYAVIRVDPRIREEIIKNQRHVYINTSSYYVKDHIHVTQCFTCQNYGHKRGSPYCPLKDKNKDTCLYCAEDHKSSSCTVKRDFTKHKCANCANTTKYCNAANHTSTSRQCPIQEIEINRIVRRTDCDSKNYPIQRTNFQSVKTA